MWHLVNPAAYGLPQDRTRVWLFFVGFDLAAMLPAAFKARSASAMQFVRIAESQRFSVDALAFTPGSSDDNF